jgi:hypothetical protein
MPIAMQLAIKKINDPLLYDRQKTNILRGRQADAITEGEVMVATIELEAKRLPTGYLFERIKF